MAHKPRRHLQGQNWLVAELCPGRSGAQLGSSAGWVQEVQKPLQPVCIPASLWSSLSLLCGTALAAALSCSSVHAGCQSEAHGCRVATDCCPMCQGSQAGRVPVGSGSSVPWLLVS